MRCISEVSRRAFERMKKTKRIAGQLAAILCAVLAPYSNEALAQVAVSPVSVEVENRSLSIQNLQGLDFGRFLPYGRTGTIVLQPDGSVQANNVHLVDPGAVRPSTWDISGTPGAPYSVLLPGVGNVIGNGMSMSISPFMRSGPATLSLDATGAARLSIGGVLNIPPYIVPGAYSGVFLVTVQYN